MMKLLISEPPLQVLPSLAIAIGLNEAIVTQQIHYYLLTSQHEYDGRKWVYNTYEEWMQHFPFWCRRTIQGIFLNLEKKGILIVGNYNKLKIDRTKWYSIDYDTINKIERATRKNCTIEDANFAHSDSTNFARPLPKEKNINHKNKEYLHFDDMQHVKITKVEFDKLTEVLGNEEAVMTKLYSYASWILGQSDKRQKNGSPYLTILAWHRDDKGKKVNIGSHQKQNNYKPSQAIPKDTRTEEERKRDFERLEEVYAARDKKRQEEGEQLDIRLPF